jgi:hypothetical protein
MERKRSVRRQRRYERPFAKKCKDLCRQFIAFLFSNVGIIGLVVSIVVFFAFSGDPRQQMTSVGFLMRGWGGKAGLFGEI